MEQIKALNALAPFIALTKSATSPRAAIDLITRATSAPGTYIFTELLETPQIQALSTASPDQAVYLTLLQIFSYGTYTDYKNTPSLPTLTPPQTLKLRQLSFLSLAKSPENLTYKKLLSELDLQDVRDLEDLVISAIYAGLITGTLDPYNQAVSISSVAPLRDLPPNTIPSMLTTLSLWSARCTSTLSSLEAQIASIKAEALRRHKDEQESNAHVEKMFTPPEESKIASTISNIIGGGRMTRSGGKRVSEDSDEEMNDADMDGESGLQKGRVEKEKNPRKRGFGVGLGK